jgi:hypothetical protein
VDTTIARAYAKQIQIFPNKSKQKSLDLFGFLWPIRGFSMSYGRKNKKISLRLNSPQVAPDLPAHALLTFALSPLAAGRPTAEWILPIKICSTKFCLTQGIASTGIASTQIAAGRQPIVTDALCE